MTPDDMPDDALHRWFDEYGPPPLDPRLTFDHKRWSTAVTSGTSTARPLRARWWIAAAAMVVAMIAVPYATPARIPLRTPARSEWQVGPFRLQAEPLAPMVVNRPTMMEVGPDTLVRIARTGGRGSYLIWRRTLGRGRWRVVTGLACAVPLVWTGIQGPEATLLCAGGAATPSFSPTLIAIPPAGRPSVYVLPVHLTVPVQWVDLQGMIFGGPRGDLLWWMDERSEPPVVLGSGLLHLANGHDAPIPTTLSGNQPDKRHLLATLLSPNDTLYELRFSATSATGTLYRWSLVRRTWARVGWALSRGLRAVQNDGTVWAVQPITPSSGIPLAWYLLCKRPDSSQTERWALHGTLVAVGPGYALYIPVSDPATLAAFFPLQHRTVRFTDLTEPPNLWGPVITQVAIASTARAWYVDPAMTAVLVGKGRHLVQITVTDTGGAVIKGRSRSR